MYNYRITARCSNVAAVLASQIRRGTDREGLSDPKGLSSCCGAARRNPNEAKRGLGQKAKGVEGWGGGGLLQQRASQRETESTLRCVSLLRCTLEFGHAAQKFRGPEAQHFGRVVNVAQQAATVFEGESCCPCTQPAKCESCVV